MCLGFIWECKMTDKYATLHLIDIIIKKNLVKKMTQDECLSFVLDKLKQYNLANDKLTKAEYLSEIMINYINTFDFGRGEIVPCNALKANSNDVRGIIINMTNYFYHPHNIVLYLFDLIDDLGFNARFIVEFFFYSKIQKELHEQLHIHLTDEQIKNTEEYIKAYWAQVNKF